MNKNISGEKNKLLDVINSYADMYGDYNLLRSILIQLGSLDPMYVTDEELCEILTDAIDRFVDDSDNKYVDIIKNVLSTPVEFESWASRALMHSDVKFVDDSRYMLTKETEKVAFERYSSRYANYKFIPPMEEDKRVPLVQFLIQCGLVDKDDDKLGNYDGYMCTSLMSYIVTGGLVKYPEVYSLYLEGNGSPYWKFKLGAPVRNPSLMDTLGSCISRGKLSFNMIYDYSTPILAYNCYNLVKYGIVVNNETKHVLLMDKHRIVSIFHQIFSDADYLK